jgi:serine/threonine-protein kinase
MTELGPRDPNSLWDLAGTYMWLRRFAEANRALERALIIYPDYEVARIFLFTSVFAVGDTARAATVAREAEGHVSLWTAAMLGSQVALVRRDYASAIRLLTEGRPVTVPEQRGRLLLLALAYHAAGQAGPTAVYADSVRRQAEDDLRRLAGWRDVFGSLADVHGQLGLAHALLGHKEEAVKEGQTAVALNPVSRDAMEGGRSTSQLAAIYVLIGDRDAALERLRYLATSRATHWRPGPSILTAAVLRLDPLYDPLRGDPRFEALVREAREREKH